MEILLNSVETYSSDCSLCSSVWIFLQRISRAEIVTFCAPMKPVNTPSVAPVTPVSFCFERKDTDNYLADGVNNCLVKDQDPFCADDRTTYAVAKGCGRGAAEVLGWMEGALDLGCKPRTAETDAGEVVADMGCYQFWRRPGMLLFLR